VYLKRLDASNLPHKYISMAVALKDAHQQFTQYLASRKRARATIVAYGKDIEQVSLFLGNMGKKTIN